MCGADADRRLGELLHPGLPYLRGEVVWAVRNEMARTVDDVLARRLRALLLDARAAIECAEETAGLMADELGMDETWIEQQVADFREMAGGYLP
jgi:glycerol-3-phosphate dehydrogenase